jgi:hypothetical protein
MKTRDKVGQLDKIISSEISNVITIMHMDAHGCTWMHMNAHGHVNGIQSKSVGKSKFQEEARFYSSQYSIVNNFKEQDL